MTNKEKYYLVKLAQSEPPEGAVTGLKGRGGIEYSRLPDKPVASTPPASDNNTLLGIPGSITKFPGQAIDLASSGFSELKDAVKPGRDLKLWEHKGFGKDFRRFNAARSNINEAFPSDQSMGVGAKMKMYGLMPEGMKNVMASPNFPEVTNKMTSNLSNWWGKQKKDWGSLAGSVKGHLGKSKET